MMNLKYKVCDPSGNITILVTDEVSKEKRIEVADKLLKLEPTGQQVGFISKGDASCDLEINMAGDEFCGNAALSGAALYKQSHSDTDIVRIKMSGAKDVIDVTVLLDGEQYIATAQMPMPDMYEHRTFAYAGKEYRTFLVKFDSMVHLVMLDRLNDDDIKPAIKQWNDELQCDALGIMDYDEDTSVLIPAVLSNNGSFFCFESSCASGTTAVAIYLAEKYKSEIEREIKEPGGVLKISAKPGGYVVLTNTVRISE